MLALSSFRFYNGATLGVPTSLFPAFSISHDDLDEHCFSKKTLPEMRKGLQELAPGLTIIDAESRVDAAAWRGDEFIIGDASGYLRAFDMKGNFRWCHFIGSSITAIDPSEDGKTLVVASCAGFLCILDVDTGERDPFTISTATNCERRRWLFWAKEPTPLVW